MQQPIKPRLARLQQLWKDLSDINLKLGFNSLHPGIKASLQRNKVFLQEKILKGLKDLRRDMEPEFLFKVTYDDMRSIKRILVLANNEEEVKLYLKTREALEQATYVIHSIETITANTIIKDTK